MRYTTISFEYRIHLFCWLCKWFLSYDSDSGDVRDTRLNAPQFGILENIWVMSWKAKTEWPAVITAVRFPIKLKSWLRNAAMLRRLTKRPVLRRKLLVTSTQRLAQQQLRFQFVLVSRRCLERVPRVSEKTPSPICPRRDIFRKPRQKKSNFSRCGSSLKEKSKFRKRRRPTGGLCLARRFFKAKKVPGAADVSILHSPFNLDSSPNLNCACRLFEEGLSSNQLWVQKGKFLNRSPGV